MMLNMGMRHFKVRLFRKPGLGVCHGDDLFYLFPFKTPGFPAALVSDTDVHHVDPVDGQEAPLLAQVQNHLLTY